MLGVEYSAIQGLQDYVEAMPRAAIEGARIALNDVAAGSGLAIFRNAVADEIDFPPGYLNDDRLGVESRATNSNLAVTIVGRDRPTSLARFVSQVNLPGKYGVTVQVKRGRTRQIKRGFIIRLKNGNKGLAIRLKPGERLSNTTGAKQIGANTGLYLLYGPSVDQVFREVGPDKTPEVLAEVEQEFYRQFFRLSGKTRG